MDEKESVGAFARWWKEIAGQINVRVLMAILFMVMGYFNKLSYDVLEGKRLSFMSNVARAIISMSVGSIALFVCLYNNIGVLTYVVPFICAFLGDKIMKFILVKFEQLINEKLALLWDKIKLIATLLSKGSGDNTPKT